MRRRDQGDETLPPRATKTTAIKSMRTAAATDSESLTISNTNNMLGLTSNTNPASVECAGTTEDTSASCSASQKTRALGALYQHYHSNDNSDKPNTTKTYHSNSNSTSKMSQQQRTPAKAAEDSNSSSSSSLSALGMSGSSLSQQMSNAQQNSRTISQQTSRLEGFNHQHESPAPTSASVSASSSASHNTRTQNQAPPTANNTTPATNRNHTTSSTSRSSASATIEKPPASFHLKALLNSASKSSDSSSSSSAKSASLSLLHLFFFLICLSSVGLSLYGHIRQTHTEHSLRHFRLLDERLDDMEMQLRLQQQQLQQITADIQQQRYTSQSLLRRNDDEDMDADADDDIDDEFEDASNSNNSDYPVAEAASYGGLRERGLNSVLHLDNTKDVTQAVRLLTRQVGELHRLRRDVSQLQLSRRQHTRRQTGAGSGLGGATSSSSHERLAAFQECGCPPGELEYEINLLKTL